MFWLCLWRVGCFSGRISNKDILTAFTRKANLWIFGQCFSGPNDWIFGPVERFARRLHSTSTGGNIPGHAEILHLPPNSAFKTPLCAKHIWARIKTLPHCEQSFWVESESCVCRVHLTQSPVQCSSPISRPAKANPEPSFTTWFSSKSKWSSSQQLPHIFLPHDWQSSCQLNHMSILAVILAQSLLLGGENVEERGRRDSGQILSHQGVVLRWHCGLEPPKISVSNRLKQSWAALQRFHILLEYWDEEKKMSSMSALVLVQTRLAELDLFWTQRSHTGLAGVSALLTLQVWELIEQSGSPHIFPPSSFPARVCAGGAAGAGGDHPVSEVDAHLDQAWRGEP